MDYIIDGGKCKCGIESTVVRVDGDVVKIIRPGSITKEQIEKVTPLVILDKNIFDDIKDGEKVISPGMKYRHYAPNTKSVLVYSSDNDIMIEKIRNIAKSNNNNVIIICSKENKDEYIASNVLNYGSKNNLEEISSNIFTLLRKADKLGASIIIIEGLPKIRYRSCNYE